MENIGVTNVTAWDANPKSLLDNDPQLIATSHTYSLNWEGVQYKDLSVGRLLLLISITRAETSEAILQNDTEMLTRQTASFTYEDVKGSHTTTLGSYLQNVLAITVDNYYPDVTPWGEPQITAIISGIKTRQDELNTISQKTTINIKDLVTKRDQAYLMETNALKRLLKDAESTANSI